MIENESLPSEHEACRLMDQILPTKLREIHEMAFKRRKRSTKSLESVHCDRHPERYALRNPRPARKVRLPRNMPKDAEDINPWERLRSKFSGQVPLSTLGVSMEHLDSQLESQHEASQLEKYPSHDDKEIVYRPKSTDTSTQVNIFHCKECRNHLKYGQLCYRDSESDDCDSESNPMKSSCLSCCGGSEDDCRSNGSSDGSMGARCSSRRGGYKQECEDDSPNQKVQSESPKVSNEAMQYLEKISKNPEVHVKQNEKSEMKRLEKLETKNFASITLPNLRMHIIIAILILMMLLVAINLTTSNVLPNLQLYLNRKKEPEISYFWTLFEKFYRLSETRKRYTK